MADLLPDIRNAVRALIIEHDRVLLLRKEGGERGVRFALPGGAQDTGETLKEALNRECLEEIGTRVDIGTLVHVAEFFKLRSGEPPTRRHLVEFVFRCSAPEGYVPRNGHRPDKHQVDVAWVALSDLAALSIFPPYLTECIGVNHNADSMSYLGAFHDREAAKEH